MKLIVHNKNRLSVLLDDMLAAVLLGVTTTQKST